MDFIGLGGISSTDKDDVVGIVRVALDESESDTTVATGDCVRAKDSVIVDLPRWHKSCLTENDVGWCRHYEKDLKFG